MALLKGNLHAHTTFSDGRRPIDQVIARYRELGYDFLAITDHDDRIHDDYWFHIPPGDDRMLILPGVELDYRPLSQHVGKVTGDRETLYVLNHPARYGLTVEETLRRVRVITEGRPRSTSPSAKRAARSSSTRSSSGMSWTLGTAPCTLCNFAW